MDKIKIGILGGSGAVGRTAARILSEKGYSCTLTYRTSYPENDNIKNADEVRLDLDNENELKGFCRRCDVILNCTGPSYIYSEKVAAAALESGCRYADPFGSVLMSSEKIKEMCRHGSCITGAGTVPGLSGAACLIMNKRYGGRCIRLYTAGREESTMTSMKDMILSSAGDSYGRSEYFMKEGKLCREQMTDERLMIEGINEEFSAKPFLYNELSDLASWSGINEIHSYNLIPETELQKKMGIVLSEYMIDRTPETLERCAQELVKLNSVSLFGVNKEYIILVRAECNENDTYEMTVRIKNSYETTGMAASLAAEALAETEISGIHWVYEAVSADRLIEAAVNAGAEVLYRKISAEDEEGEI